eukprot:7507061-Alexandrium_andersonii.AAC.1
MSASLVGSEMCIRDSGSHTCADCCATRPEVPPEAQGSATGFPPACVRPVSYTHLTLPTICSV